VDLKMGESMSKAESHEGLIPNIGDRMWVVFRSNRLHIFDMKTEKAIV
jgi:hypothetical protein